MEKTNIKPCWVIYGNVYQTKKSKYVARILETLRTLQVNVLIEQQFANFLAHNLHIDIADYSLFCPEETPRPMPPSPSEETERFSPPPRNWD